MKILIAEQKESSSSVATFELVQILHNFKLKAVCIYLVVLENLLTLSHSGNGFFFDLKTLKVNLRLSITIKEWV